MNDKDICIRRKKDIEIEIDGYEKKRLTTVQ